MATEESPVARVRQPAYTGENRCWPCTALNVLLAGVGSLVVAGGLATVGPRLLAGGTGTATFVVSLLAIYLRGYLVPGTPELTKRYMPAWLRTAIHAEAATAENEGWEGEASANDDVEGSTSRDSNDETHHRQGRSDPETFLLEAGAIREGETDLELTDPMRRRVEDGLARCREEGVSDATIAGLFDVDVAVIERVERSTPAVSVHGRIHRWPSEAALFSDVATHEALAATTEDWGSVHVQQRLDVLRALRSFRETYPACDGALVSSERVVESCCSSTQVLTITCEACEARVLEVDASIAEPSAR